MITEEQIIKSVTDKLIEVARHPEMREEFIVSVENKGFYCYKNNPMMCDVDKYVLASYYAGNILYTTNETECLECYNKSLFYIREMNDRIDSNRLLVFLYGTMVHFYKQKGDTSKAIEYICSQIFWSTLVPNGVDIDQIKKWRRLEKQSKDECGEGYYLPFLLEMDSYFKDYEKRLRLAKNPDETNYAQEAKAYVYKRAREIHAYENELDEQSDWVPMAILQAYGIVDTIKHPKPKKGEFDYYYNKAEKGDTKAQRMIADCYRNGDVVSKNERLANFWQVLADEHRYIE